MWQSLYVPVAKFRLRKRMFRKLFSKILETVELRCKHGDEILKADHMVTFRVCNFCTSPYIPGPQYACIR